MSVLAFSMAGKTSGEVQYLKESVLLAKENQTKIIMRLVISFDREDYIMLRSRGELILRMLTPFRVGGDLNNLQHKMIIADPGRKESQTSEYRYLSKEDKNTAEKYIKAFGFPADLPEDKLWVGIAWKPRENMEEMKFFVPLFADVWAEIIKGMVEIRIDFSRFAHPLETEKLNVGFMFEYYTRDIPEYRNSFMITYIDIYNKTLERSIEGLGLEREKILRMGKGELWIQYPLDAYLITAMPNPQSFRLQTIYDQKIAQETQRNLYGISRLSEYLPRKGMIPVRWDLDKHIEDWNNNGISFISVALLTDDFKRSLLKETEKDFQKLLSDLRNDTIESVRRDILTRKMKLDEIEVEEEKGWKIPLIKGDNLISDANRNRTYRMFAEQIKSEYDEGLCITNREKDPILERISTRTVKTVNLVTGKTALKGLTSIQDIIKEVESSVRQKNRLVVLLDGLEFISAREKDFENVLEFLQVLIELIRLNDGILLVPIDPFAFELTEFHQIKTCFQSCL